jgi:hypothetical protein
VVPGTLRPSWLPVRGGGWPKRWWSRRLTRHLDVLALPRGVPLVECGQDADRHVHAGAGIADRRPHVGRRAVGKAGDAHGTAHGLGDRLETLEAAEGTVGAEALDGGVDEPRVDLGERLVAEPQAVERAWPEVLDQHVGLGDHLPEQALALLRLEVERQALLVGVEHEEEQAVAVLLVTHVGARDVATLGLLELDHVGAEEGQHLRAGRSCLVVRHVDDADAGQGLGHVFLSR